MMVNGSNTVRAYWTPGVSKVAVVGSKPFSSAVVPKTSLPPFLGLAVEMPLACLVPELFDADWAAEARPVNSPPVAPARVNPAAAAVPLARNERRSIGFGIVPLVRAAPESSVSPTEAVNPAPPGAPPE